MELPIAPQGRGALAGLRILVTRAVAQAPDLVQAIEARGGVAVVCPVVEIEALASAPEVAAAAADADVIVVTSANAAAALDVALMAPDRRAPDVWAIGDGTAAALASRGTVARQAPEVVAAEGLARHLLESGEVARRRVLVLAAETPAVDIARTLRDAGVEARHLATHRTVPSTGAAVALRDGVGDVDLVTLLSASAVSAWVDAAGRERAALCPVAVIGPATAAAAAAAGLRVAVEAPGRSIDALCDAIAAARATFSDAHRLPS